MTQSSTTRLVRNLVDGRPGAAEELLPVVYDELHRLARSMLGGGAGGASTLGPTALIHEAWLRLVDPDAQKWGGREHFVRVGAKAMRYVMIDHARSKARQKRGGGQAKVTLDEGAVASPDRAEEILSIHEALERLEEQDPRLAEIVELRFFVGLSPEETASTMNMSRRSVDRNWRLARAFLLGQLQAGAE